MRFHEIIDFRINAYELKNHRKSLVPTENGPIIYVSEI